MAWNIDSSSKDPTAVRRFHTKREWSYEKDNSILTAAKHFVGQEWSILVTHRQWDAAISYLQVNVARFRSPNGQSNHHKPGLFSFTRYLYT